MKNKIKNIESNHKKAVKVKLYHCISSNTIISLLIFHKNKYNAEKEIKRKKCSYLFRKKLFEEHTS
jgi:hypothetical protein